MNKWFVFGSDDYWGFTRVTLLCLNNKLFSENLCLISANSSPESDLLSSADNGLHYQNSCFFTEISHLYKKKSKNWFGRNFSVLWPFVSCFQSPCVFNDFPFWCFLWFSAFCAPAKLSTELKGQPAQPGHVCARPCLLCGLLSAGECLENRFLWRWRHRGNTDLAINLDVTVITKSL